MEKKFTSFANSSAIKAADGTSIMVPIGILRLKGMPSSSSSSFTSARIILHWRNSMSVPIMGNMMRTSPWHWPENGTQLRFEQGQIPQTQTYTAQPEAGILFVALHVGGEEQLVRPQIEGADDDRPLGTDASAAPPCRPRIVRSRSGSAVLLR